MRLRSVLCGGSYAESYAHVLCGVLCGISGTSYATSYAQSYAEPCASTSPETVIEIIWCFSAQLRHSRSIVRGIYVIACLGRVLWRPCTSRRLRRILFRRALPKMRSGVSEQILPNPFGSQKSYACLMRSLMRSYAELPPACEADGTYVFFVEGDIYIYIYIYIYLYSIYIYILYI